MRATATPPAFARGCFNLWYARAFLRPG
ncbi:hypothetical protein BRAS3809_470007 [Bradyrhizobium sp. STM 3809]|nr:hypothetical protein BRAS3809_470007 [Bradyrhizobium sp. STM 3809]